MDLLQFKQIQTRRDFFKWCAGGIGTIALHNLLELEGRAGTGLPAVNPLTPQRPQFTPNAKVWASQRVFKPYGKSGMEWSDLMPHLATCSDDICMIRSMFTEQFN